MDMEVADEGSEVADEGSEVDVAIIGGGMQGLAAARFFQQRGLSVALFEKASQLGGVWAAHGVAQERTIVQTEAATYSLDIPACDDASNDSEAELPGLDDGMPCSRRAVREHVARFVQRHELGASIFTEHEVVRCCPLGPTEAYKVQLSVVDHRNPKRSRQRRWRSRFLLSLAGRWKRARQLAVTGEEAFTRSGGHVVRFDLRGNHHLGGIDGPFRRDGGDGNVPGGPDGPGAPVGPGAPGGPEGGRGEEAAGFASVCVDASVVIVGVGAFAVECARVALLQGARKVTLLCRSRADGDGWGVAPRLASWAINSRDVGADGSGATTVTELAHIAWPMYQLLQPAHEPARGKPVAGLAEGVSGAEVRAAAVADAAAVPGRPSRVTARAVSDVYFAARACGVLELAQGEQVAELVCGDASESGGGWSQGVDVSGNESESEGLGRRGGRSRRVLRTQSGREIRCDVLALCVGLESDPEGKGIDAIFSASDDDDDDDGSSHADAAAAEAIAAPGPAAASGAHASGADEGACSVHGLWVRGDPRLAFWREMYRAPDRAGGAPPLPRQPAQGEPAQAEPAAGEPAAGEPVAMTPSYESTSSLLTLPRALTVFAFALERQSEWYARASAAAMQQQLPQQRSVAMPACPPSAEDLLLRTPWTPSQGRQSPAGDGSALEARPSRIQPNGQPEETHSEGLAELPRHSSAAACGWEHLASTVAVLGRPGDPALRERLERCATAKAARVTSRLPLPRLHMQCEREWEAFCATLRRSHARHHGDACAPLVTPPYPYSLDDMVRLVGGACPAQSPNLGPLKA